MSLFSLGKLFKKVSAPKNHFIGGKPLLPPGLSIPICKVCNSKQIFFFHLNLSQIETFEGKAISVFSCTTCCTPENLIPSLPLGPLKGAAISSLYLTSYQVNFSALIFNVDEGIEMEAYSESILYKEIKMDAVGNLTVGNKSFGKIGGSPVWLLGDEIPGLCDGKYKFEFLFQLHAKYRFETSNLAPRQLKLGLSGEPEHREHPYYDIFIGNVFYAFGVHVKDSGLVYFIPQV